MCQRGGISGLPAPRFNMTASTRPTAIVAALHEELASVLGAGTTALVVGDYLTTSTTASGSTSGTAKLLLTNSVPGRISA